MLDAWVHPEPATSVATVASPDADGYLRPLPAALRPAGPTLRDLLRPITTIGPAHR